MKNLGLHLKWLIFCSISWTVAIKTEMPPYLFFSFSPCCAGNVPLSLFLSKMKQAKKEAIHRSISSIIQIHLSTVRSNIVVYILPKVSKGSIRLFCFKTEFVLFEMCSFWNVLYLKCALFGLWSKQNVPFLECGQNCMCSFRNVLHFWMGTKQNGIKMECAWLGMWSFWSVLL